MLHMLRSDLGDEAFFRGIRNYYEAHKHWTATTEDLRLALEKASGKPLSNFFTRWVYGVGHPQYELAWRWQADGGLKIQLKQIQLGDAFVDPLPITVTTAEGTREIKLTPTGKMFTQTIALREKPLRLDIDPRNTLLKEIKVIGSSD